MSPIAGMPPGPRMPKALQTVGMLTRQRPFLERNRRRYGPIFSLNMGGLGRLVVVSDPDLIKQVFMTDPKTLHAGSQSPLRRVLGNNSLLGIDEEHHMEQRKLLLPPFKGQRMRKYEPQIEAIAREQIALWPEDVEFATADAMQAITLKAILQTVFGASGERMEQLERLLPRWTELGQSMSRFPRAQKDLGRFSPWGRFLRLRAQVDAILDSLIDDARRDPRVEQREDVLALMVQARRADGSELRNDEIRDQLVTMLAAGHETTAHTLSWAVERLRRHPAILARLVQEADAGGRALREATIREIQRMRPVIAFAGRHTRRPYEIAGYTLPKGVLIGLSAGLTHYDPRLFPHPDVFDPDRFLDARPETYSWIPFGGGVRRCIGATFAHMELDVVLRVLLTSVELLPTTAPDEPWQFRGVAWAPAGGGMARIRRRAQVPTQQPALSLV